MYYIWIPRSMCLSDVSFSKFQKNIFLLNCDYVWKNNVLSVHEKVSKLLYNCQNFIGGADINVPFTELPKWFHNFSFKISRIIKDT